MYISNVEINNFRSIGHVNIPIDKLNVFVGQNNHGKSNFLEAIEWFYNGSGDLNDIKRKGTDKKELSVEIEFSNIKTGLENMKNDKNRETIKKKLDGNEKVKIICRINDKGSVERLFMNPTTGEYETTGTGANNFLNDFLPKLQFVKTETSLKDVAKYGTKTEIGQMLASVVNEILISEDEEYKSFVDKFNELFIGESSRVSRQLSQIGSKVESYLKKQFKECEKVQFEVKSPKFDDLLKNFETSVDDGHKTSASEKGDGMQRALMLAIIQAYAEYRKENEKIKNFVFLIDEAELHLHPTAQRSLKNALVELSDRGDQVIITTHSSVLIVDNTERQKLFKVEKFEKITEIKEIQEKEKPNIIYDLLGGNPSDLLLPRNFLLVEGSSDKLFLDLIIQRFYPNEKTIQIVPVWGDIEKVDRVFDTLGSVFAPLDKSLYQLKTIILLDKISEARKTAFNDFFRKYKNISKEQVIELAAGSLEESYPIAEDDQAGGHNQAKDWKKTAGHGLSSNQKHSLAKFVGNAIKQKQFEDEMPIVFDALKKAWTNAY